ncbi:MAG: hypothetical protein HC872_06410 [Gammaproteobacteria bacterium]|nr:hypothetical protein [Gammaproteobacteria bacterium]
MDPTLGEPHAVLGDYYDIHGKPVEAEIALRRALELDPRDPATLHYFAIHLYSVGRLRDALEMERRSVALDGRSPQPMMWLAMLTTHVGERDEALRLWQQAEELGATRPLAAGVSRLALGQTDYLEEWYRTMLERTGVPETDAMPAVLLRRDHRPCAARPGAAVAARCRSARRSCVRHHALRDARRCAQRHAHRRFVRAGR